jgi:hypothetical protein
MAIPPIPPSPPGLPRVTSAVNNNFATFTSNGAAVKDSGVALNDTLTNTSTLWSSSQIQSYVVTQLLNVPTLPNVRVATTANITLSGAQTIDGVAVVAGDYVLVKNQTNATTNGFYLAAAGAWTEQKYNTVTQAFVSAAGTTTYGGLNINGGISFVTAGTTQKNLQYQCAIPIPGAAFPGGSAVNFTAVTKLPIASTTNRFVDVSVGNNTNNNGSQSFPYASIPQALTGAQFPLCITLTSSAPESNTITWTSGQSNTIVQGNNLTGGQQSITGAQTFSSGGTRNHFVQLIMSTGATAPFTFNSGYLFRNILRDLTITTTASSWAVLPTNASNYMVLDNIQVTNIGVSNLNLPAFTNPFAFYVTNQNNAALLFRGTGAADTQIVINNSSEYYVQVPPTYVGQIVWQNTSLNARVGSSLIPSGIITSQVQLTTVLSYTLNSLYDGNYIISGFTPSANNFNNGDMFTKITAGGVTSNFWLRTYAYAPATVASINGTVYQQASGVTSWVVVNVTSSNYQYTQVYYVDPIGGNNSNLGTYNQPWLTLDHAITFAIPGSIIYLAPGAYTLSTSNITTADLTIEGISSQAILSGSSALGATGAITCNVRNLTMASTLAANLGATLYADQCIFQGLISSSAGSTLQLTNCVVESTSTIINNATFRAFNCPKIVGPTGAYGSSTTVIENCNQLAALTVTNPSFLAIRNSQLYGGATLGAAALTVSMSTGTGTIVLSDTTIYANNVRGTGLVNFSTTGGTLNYSLDDVSFNQTTSQFGSAVRATTPFAFDALKLGTPLEVASGGTGTNALTANGALVSNSSGTAVTTVAPGANGNILTSNGTNWVSAASTVPTKVSGTWTVPPGTFSQAITIPVGRTSQLVIKGNGPNAILEYNATLGVSNNNVAVIGLQAAWYYAGNGLVWNSLPSQIIGTANTIINNNPAVVPVPSNTLTFSITNNTGSSQNVYWSYTILQ